jgi:hypothetical protein
MNKGALKLEYTSNLLIGEKKPQIGVLDVFH